MVHRYRITIGDNKFLLAWFVRSNQKFWKIAAVLCEKVCISLI